MAKPIFVVGIPNKFYQLDSEIIEKIQTNLDKRFNDYHVLVYSQYITDDLKFDCFYEKDFNEVKYKELKKIVKEKLK